MSNKNLARIGDRLDKAAAAVSTAQRRYDGELLAAREEGATLAELAALLGTSHQAVATRVRRAEARLAGV